MKLDRLVGERFKEKPADCTVDSHAFMVRGGYLKYVANGIFSSYAPLKRVTKKIEQIMREEMDAIDGQEVQFPVVMPANIWQESGRYYSIGKEMLRCNDRNNSPLVLGMTHEEASVQLVREYGQSYVKYPFMIYQIQTKFRDEARPKAGLIRVREFTMKDAYSFHTSQEDLEQYYARCHKAYERIYTRVGLPEVISVASDSGMMGGNLSHEFMLLTAIGEDSIAICSNCGYKANVEAAECIVDDTAKAKSATRIAASARLTKVHTPNSHTIEEVCGCLGCKQTDMCKAVVYQRNADDSYVVLFIRGDLEVNETKLTNYLGCDIHPAVITEDSGLVAGYIGPVGLTKNVTVLYDRSLENRYNLVCGANENEYHCIGLNMAHDVGNVEYHDFAKIQDGGICPVCGKHTITVSRGIEVGNIFQLGTKYTKAMEMTYIDKDGNLQYPIMGCYGIGVGRLAAAICEARHDDYGPVWPISVAPWQVHLCAMRADSAEVKEYADKLYAELNSKGIEVIYDDRVVSAGVMFSDADLLGVPFRVIVSPRNMKNGVVEISKRDKSMSVTETIDNACETIVKLVRDELAATLN